MVYWLLGALLSGIVAFTFTNLDDLVILTVFFGECAREKKNRREENNYGTAADVRKRLHAWNVVLGQYIGFTCLIVISLLGFLVG